MRTKVAIGMPVYNGEAYISEAIESLLAQTYCDFVLIISDNASTDQTESICREYAAKDSRIRYLRLDGNIGAVPNFNHVFQVSDSEYFKWAAADDKCDPTFLEKLVEILDKNPDVAWCHSRSTHIDSYGDIIKHSDTVDVSYANRTAEKPFQRFNEVLFGQGGCLDSYGLIRSDVIKQTQLFLPSFGSEKVFISELALHGNYQEVSESLFFPRVHAATAGNIDSAAEQQTYMSANKKVSLSPRLNMLKGYLTAIGKAQISFSEKLRCFATIGRYLFQIEKWKGIIVRAFTGAGIKGGNIDRVQQLNQ